MDKKTKPGSLPPLGGAAIPEGELVQLGEEVVGDVLKVVVLCAQDELDTLGWCVCTQSGQRKLGGEEKEGDESAKKE